MHLKTSKQIILTLMVSTLALIIVIICNYSYDIRVISMTRDVSTLGNIPPFYGFLSSIGILLWAITTSICSFTAILLHKVNQNGKFKFLVSSALISCYLLFDDLFLLHEQSDNFIQGGEYVVYTILSFSVFLFLLIFRSLLYKSNYVILLLALCFFASSIVFDTIQPWFWEKGDVHAFLEDGTKWLGICFWFSYFVYTAYTYLSLGLNKLKYQL